MASTQISAADALKAFKTRPTVQTAKRVKVKNEQNQTVEKFDTKDETATEKHVIGAAKYEDGRVVIVTLDGRKHEAAA